MSNLPRAHPTAGVYYETNQSHRQPKRRKRSRTYPRTLFQRRNDVVQVVLLVVGRRNTGVCEPRVRGERLEQLDDGLKVGHSLDERNKSELVARERVRGIRDGAAKTTHLGSLGASLRQARRLERAT